MTHHEYISGIVKNLGSVERLKRLRYEMLDGNWHNLSKQWNVNLYDLRYLDTVPKEVERYIYEQEHRQELTLVWSKVA